MEQLLSMVVYKRSVRGQYAAFCPHTSARVSFHMETDRLCHLGRLEARRSPRSMVRCMLWQLLDHAMQDKTLHITDDIKLCVYGGYLRTLGAYGRVRLIQFYELLGFSGFHPIPTSEYVPFKMLASVRTLMQQLEQQIIVKLSIPTFCNQKLHGSWKPNPEHSYWSVFVMEEACEIDETRTHCDTNFTEHSYVAEYSDLHGLREMAAEQVGRGMCRSDSLSCDKTCVQNSKYTMKSSTSSWEKTTCSLKGV